MASRLEVRSPKYNMASRDTDLVKGPQDTSPMVWDTTYFSETQAQVAPQGVFRFNSDIQLASKGQSAQAYTEFANSMSMFTVSILRRLSWY